MKKIILTLLTLLLLTATCTIEDRENPNDPKSKYAMNVAPSGKIKINDNVGYSLGRKVSLAITYSASVSHYMVSEKNDFEGASWKEIKSKASFTYAAAGIENSFYYKFKSVKGLISDIYYIKNTLIYTSIPTLVLSKYTNVKKDLLVKWYSPFAGDILPEAITAIVYWDTTADTYANKKELTIGIKEYLMENLSF